MLKYSELLKSEEWSIAREYIIVRDNYNCPQCKLSGRSVSFVSPSFLDSRDIKKFEIYVRYDNDSIELKKTIFNETYSYLNIKVIYKPVLKSNIAVLDELCIIRLNIYIENPLQSQFYNVIKEQIAKSNLNRNFIASDFFEQHSYLKLTNLFLYGNIEKCPKLNANKEKYTKLAYGTTETNIFEEDLNFFIIGDSKHLNVHHHFYKTSLLPWNYSKNDLTTFCFECHNKFHLENKVPVYNDEGEEINVNWCMHCNGTGFKPEFEYYKDGMCFQCNGNGFNL